MKQTLLNWYQQNELNLEEVQRLSEIVESNTEYTLAELKLLSQLPATSSLAKFQKNLVQEQIKNFWTKNWPWLIALGLIVLLYLLKC